MPAKQDKQRSLFDRFVIILGIGESLTTLPQLYEVWFKHQTAGVSIITWTSYSLIECIWVIYGFRQSDPAIIGGSISWGLMEALVALGAAIK